MSDHHDSPADDAHGHDAHGAVDAESSPVDVDRPTPLSAFIWPGLIFLLVLILVWGPVTGAFSTYKGGANANGQPTPTLAPPTVAPTTAPAITPSAAAPETIAPAPPSMTVAPATVTSVPPTAASATDTAVPATATVAPAPPTATVAPAAPTDTVAPPSATPAAALPPADIDLQKDAPKSVTFAGKTFPVTTSSTTLPDWAFSKDPGVANWMSGTVTNYVLGISYSPANANLFAGVRSTDTIRITRADGAVYAFAVDLVARVAPTNIKALQQDHPAVTLLLLGDPAPTRVVIQGHYVEGAAP